MSKVPPIEKGPETLKAVPTAPRKAPKMAGIKSALGKLKKGLAPKRKPKG